MTARLVGVVVVCGLVLGLCGFLLLGDDDAPRARSQPAKPPTPATPATLERVFADARGGDTIALAAGDYGTFHGDVKPSTVTLTAQEGADARMAIEFDGAANVRIDGLTLTGMELAGATRDVTIRNARFTGMALIRAEEMRDAGIVLERDTFAGIDKCDGCFEGRLTITGDGGAPSGIVVRDSTFGPGGVSDGILNGGHGVAIVRNRFTGLQGGGVDGVHVDAIQLYGSRATLIQGNRIEDTATGIMAPDGTDHEVIEGNLIAPGEYPYAIMLAGDDGSVIRGNELPAGACAFDKTCGTLVIESGKDGTPSRGTVVEDNTLGALQLDAGSTLASDARNTIAASPTP
jgi:hypothetical protein